MLPDFTQPKETKMLKTGTNDPPIDGISRSAFCSDKLCGENQKPPESTGEMTQSLNAQKSLISSEKPHFEPTGPGWIRTNVGASRRIYSPSPLATRAPTLKRWIILVIAGNARGRENFSEFADGFWKAGPARTPGIGGDYSCKWVCGIQLFSGIH
jgi:hypothetical protein